MSQQRETNTILIVQMLLICVIVVTGIVLRIREFGSPSRSDPRGLLHTLSDWPQPIQDLYRSLSDASVETETLSIFLLTSGMDESCVCRMDVDDAGWDVIQQTLDLQAIPESDIDHLRDSIVSNADSTWWPTRSDNYEYFASKGVLVGNEGDLYWAARNSHTDRVYIYYYFNF